MIHCILNLAAKIKKCHHSRLKLLWLVHELTQKWYKACKNLQLLASTNKKFLTLTNTYWSCHLHPNGQGLKH